MHRSKLLLSLILTLCACSPSPACGETLYRPDADEDARPWTFWYWMHGAVSRRGITADLEAMRYEGLGGCYLMPIYGPDRAPELGGTLRQLTPEWWQMVNFALHEADRLGLKIGMHICTGNKLQGLPSERKNQLNFFSEGKANFKIPFTNQGKTLHNFL